VEEVTVANELKHVMYYMNVMQHRVGRDFEIDVAIEPRFLLKKMVRLTLQPLVENVFQHAFDEGVEDYHFIRIDCGEEQGRFWVSVEDNGCGFAPDRLRRLHEQLAANRLADEATDEEGNKGGIGVINVHRRVQMVFGDEYGLTVTSEAGVGTIVKLMMPAS
jgi:two-component system sensor histidine kinase YesM